jgi:type IV pilus assembly protein PilQ
MNQFCMRSADRPPTAGRAHAPGWARRLVAVLMAGAVAAVPAAWSQGQNSIRSITTATEGGNEVVRVELDKPLSELPKGFSIQSPARIALDFAGVGNGTGRSAVELNQGNVKSANVIEAGDRTRVVLNLGQASQYQAQIAGNTLLVVLQGGAAAAAPRSSSQAMFAEAGNRDV